MRKIVLASTAVIVASAAWLGAQQSQAPSAPAAPVAQAPTVPRPTFRLEIDYVEVDAIVTDRSGSLVNDLTRDDFEVFEDGRRQDVELFTRVDVPIERPDPPLNRPLPIEPDVKINEPFDGRVYVLLIDDVHTAATRSALVRRAATRFIDRYLGTNDLAAVVFTSGRADAGQEFTSSKRLLKAAIDRSIGQKMGSETLARQQAYRQELTLTGRAPTSVRDPDDFERGYKARMSLDALKSVASYLEGVRGRRKALLFFSEGIDYDIYDVFNKPDATTVLQASRDAIGAATRANVVFYTIDPRGLATMGEEGMELGPPPEDPALGIDTTGLHGELRRAQDSLRVLAEQTGGRAVVNANDFNTAFARIQEENSTYYVIGYYPTNTKRDGRFRKLEVRVTRPGLTVRARKGYVAPKGRAESRDTEVSAGTSAVLRRALASPLPESDLPLAVQVVPFKGAARKASVAVVAQFAGRFLAFTQKESEFLNTIELSMIAVDREGKVRAGDRQTIDLKLRPETHARVLSNGFRMLSRFEIAPGRYQLRVAARESGGKIGSLLYDLEVPDFADEDFSMSGLAVTSNAAGATPTGRPDESLSQVLATPPTVIRDFLTVETLSVFAEIYDNDTKPHSVDITTSVVDEKGAAVFKTEDQRSSSELGGARGGYGYTADIPLAEIAEGRYVLRVEAKSRLGDRKAVVRETEFRVYQPKRQTQPAQQGRAIVPVDRGPISGVAAPKTVVVRTQEELDAFWATLTTRRPVPKVTFANTMLAAVFLGERPTAGYAVDVVSVGRDGDALVIGYAERTPARDVMVGQVLTSPYVIVGVPAHAGTVSFIKVESGAGGGLVQR